MELLWLIWVTRDNEIKNGKLGKKKKRKNMKLDSLYLTLSSPNPGYNESLSPVK